VGRGLKIVYLYVLINKYTLRIFALWCVYLYTSVVVPVLHDIHNIYERLPTKYTYM
jgi:hypothetical protein